MGGDPFDEINFAGGGGLRNANGETSGAEGRIRRRVSANPFQRATKEGGRFLLPSIHPHKRFSLPLFQDTNRTDRRIRVMPGRANNEPILFHVEFLSLYYHCTPPFSAPAKIYRRRPAFRHADPKDFVPTIYRKRFRKIVPRFVTTARSLTWKLS